MKTALILGVTGQDGAYLARDLLKSGYRVIGTSRILSTPSRNLKALEIIEDVELQSIDITNPNEIAQLVDRFTPDEIYHLAGVTSVANSFSEPVETHRSIVLSTQNILETLRASNSKTRFYNAASGEMYGNLGRQASESDPFSPLSPYARAKVEAYSMVKQYRETYNLFCCSGILFNHESPLRSDQFVTQKIISTAKLIAGGENIKLKLGNLNISRDWGWAPNYVKAMQKMLLNKHAGDFVIATGVLTSLEDFIRITFESLDLNWMDFVESVPTLLRPSDVTFSSGNARKARDILEWSPKVSINQMIIKMLNGEVD